jgi:hypothetical protein
MWMTAGQGRIGHELPAAPHRGRAIRGRRARPSDLHRDAVHAGLPRHRDLQDQEIGGRDRHGLVLREDAELARQDPSGKL